ncbi:MAG: BrnA antitoxin family protein [Acidobacteriota bacterium]|nr:BrnA antitoxin family protein [Acidobacteriota bacterium]
MAKKSSASSQRAPLKSMNTEGIKSRQLTKREDQALDGIAARQMAGDDSRINFKGIPRLTNGQLAAMLRFRDVRPRKRAVSVRLDERVLVWLKSKGQGHLTLINDILANLMEAELKAGRDV